MSYDAEKGAIDCPVCGCEQWCQPEDAPECTKCGRVVCDECRVLFGPPMCLECATPEDADEDE